MTKYLLLLLAIFITTPVLATNKNAQLDQLFNELKSAPDQQTAITIEEKIWLLWFQSGNSEVDKLMGEAMTKRQNRDFNGALKTLNKVIKLDPSYAEAWNQRATVYFRQEKFEESLVDIAEVLELEPRHFGALAGRAVIRLIQQKPVIAQRNIQEALKYHPFLKEKSFFPQLQ